jgi:dienelactone hydrolase
VIVGQRGARLGFGQARGADTGKTQARADGCGSCDVFDIHGTVVPLRWSDETRLLGVLTGDLLSISLISAGVPTRQANRAGADVRYRQRVAKTSKLVGALARRGPHRVLRGDLAFAGLPGVVYTPDSGFNLPGVAFGHDWLTGVARYTGLLEHLASWGIVAAAPDTERGVAPSVLNLAFDLGTALDIAAGVRLGPGQISVHPGKLGVIGHGFGGSAAVFAAAGMKAKPQAVAALYPTITNPPAEQPASTLNVPGVVFSAPGSANALRSNAIELWQAWDTATLRIIAKARPTGLAEGRRLTTVFGLGAPDRKTQKTTRALLTGYLLYALTGDKTYRDFADPDVQLPGTLPVGDEAAPLSPEEKFVALLKG